MNASQLTPHHSLRHHLPRPPLLPLHPPLAHRGDLTRGGVGELRARAARGDARDGRVHLRRRHGRGHEGPRVGGHRGARRGDVRERGASSLLPFHFMIPCRDPMIMRSGEFHDSAIWRRGDYHYHCDPGVAMD